VARWAWSTFIFEHQLLVLECPGRTAWIIVGYFVAARSPIDGFFSRRQLLASMSVRIVHFTCSGSFCSPLAVKLRTQEICRSCKAILLQFDAMPSPRCELLLFQQRRDHLDCTFCLDCVRAVHTTRWNYRTTRPGRYLDRSSTLFHRGRFARRADLAVLG